MNRISAALLFVAVLNSATPARAQLEWTPQGAAWAVLSGIASYEGAQAWKRYRHIPNEQELQRKTVSELASVMKEEVQNARLGQALSYFFNADRELEYYINNPVDNANSLEEARTQSSYALNEFEQMGLQGLRLYPTCAILHMAVLQEKLKIAENQKREQKNIETHMKRTRAHVNGITAKMREKYGWLPDTYDRAKVDRPTGPVNPNQLQIEIVDMGEVNIRLALIDAQLVVDTFFDPKGSFKDVRKRIEAEKKKKLYGEEHLKALPIAPINANSLALPPK